MQNPEGEHKPSIELDLGPENSPFPRTPYRGRPIQSEPMPSAPKIEPILKEGDIGTDEAQRTVGLLFLLSVLPNVITLITGHSIGGLFSLAIPLYFGFGILRGDEFVMEWLKAACFINFLMGPIYFFITPGAYLFILAGLVRNLCLLIFVTNNGLSKRAYRLCLGGVLAGVLLGCIAASLR